VPVPAIVTYDDGDLLGVPCYVMTRVPGLVIRDRLPSGFAAGHAERLALGYALTDCLAECMRSTRQRSAWPASAVRTALSSVRSRRWRAQWEASADVAVPAVDQLAGRLAARLPVSPAAAIAHGDYRLDQLHHRRGAIRAG